MALNESKRKRSLPDWMKSPKKPSPVKSTDSKAHGSVGLKTQRPSYPPISIKKTKQLPKRLERWEPETDNAGRAGPSRVNEFESFIDDPNYTKSCSSSISNVSSKSKPSAEELDAFIMSVDDLTRVAQEVIKEEHQKNAKRLLSDTQKRAPS